MSTTKIFKINKCRRCEQIRSCKIIFAKVGTQLVKFHLCRKCTEKFKKELEQVTQNL